MSTENNLTRFLDAQKGDYEIALKEIKKGKKTSHWMWYIFPQINGLGFSDTSKFYAIKNKDEATEYLHHDILGKRLIEISTELLKLNTSNAIDVFGHVDNLKLKSSMTLFASVVNADNVFQQVLDKFYHGERDKVTLNILGLH